MSSFEPAQVFTELGLGNEKLTMKNVMNQIQQKRPVKPMVSEDKNNSEKFIRVTASSEIPVAPDRCKVTLIIHSLKDNVQEARNSVSRRLDYILQVLNNHQVKESDIHICKVLSREDAGYSLNAEVTVSFYDTNRCQDVVNILVEKLDRNVNISKPAYSHSPQRLSNIRCQASTAAVKIAKEKAIEMAKYLNSHIGQVRTIEEEFCSDSEGAASIYAHEPGTAQYQLSQSTLLITAKVVVSFDLKQKGK